MQSMELYCKELSKFLGGANSQDELTQVLRSLLTPAEIESIAQRLSILDGISLGVAQREIAETLRVGIATVTRGSRVWQENRDCLGKYFPRPGSLFASEAAESLQTPPESSPQNTGAASASDISKPAFVIDPSAPL